MFKLIAPLLAALAVAAALHHPDVDVGVNQQPKLGGQDVAHKQKMIVQLLRHVGQENTHPELAALGQSWNPEHMLDRYANQRVVKKFVSMWKNGMLPRGETFNTNDEQQLEEAIALFDMLYFAKDFDTLIKTAAWARDNVNEGQFIYALSVAVVNHEGLDGVQLPPLYEVTPELYINNQDLQEIQSAKMQGKQNYVIHTNWTNGEEIQNEEQQIGYFTEDVGLNAFHAYAHLHQPIWMNSEKYGLTNTQSRGEAFYYFYQQMLAHYNLHRMANDLPEQDQFDWEQPIQQGYNPELVYPSGQIMPPRADQMEVTSIKSYSVQDIKNIEARIKDAIDSGVVIAKDGSRIPIQQQLKGINILGNIVEGNEDSVNSRYYKSYTTMLRSLLALIMDPENKHGNAPGAIANYETALRDPAFYILQKQINDLLKQHKDNLPSYRTEDLVFPGVAVKDVATDKLVTYFDLFDVDVTNAVDVASIEESDKVNLIARTQRLNHKQFNIKVKVDSDKKTNAIVRIFLGPSSDLEKANLYGVDNSQITVGSGKDTILDLDRLRNYFVEIDRFTTQLKQGENLIVRNSRELTSTTGDHQTLKNLLKTAESGNVYVQDLDKSCGFPDRLVLPKGKRAGLPLSLLVVVSPKSGMSQSDETSEFYRHQSQLGSGILSCNGLVTALDNRALGWPLDREIKNVDKFYTPNMYLKTVQVFHKDSSDNNGAILIKKNVNDFDSIVSQTVPKYTPKSHRVMDEDIVRGDEDVRAYL